MRVERKGDASEKPVMRFIVVTHIGCLCAARAVGELALFGLSSGWMENEGYERADVREMEKRAKTQTKAKTKRTRSGRCDIAERRRRERMWARNTTRKCATVKGDLYDPGPGALHASLFVHPVYYVRNGKLHMKLRLKRRRPRDSARRSVVCLI